MTTQGQEFKLREIAVVLVSSLVKPQQLNIDFLKMHKIVDEDWNLSDDISPKISQVFSLVPFNNGVQISSEPGKITFRELLSGKEAQPSRVYSLVKKYHETFLEGSVQAIGINPSGDYIFRTYYEALSYLCSKILKEKSWDKTGGSVSFAQLRYSVELPDCMLHINLAVKILKENPKDLIPVLAIEGNFHHDIEQKIASVRREFEKKILDAADDKIEIFKTIKDIMFSSE